MLSCTCSVNYMRVGGRVLIRITFQFLFAQALSCAYWRGGSTKDPKGMVGLIHMALDTQPRLLFTRTEKAIRNCTPGEGVNIVLVSDKQTHPGHSSSRGTQYYGFMTSYSSACTSMVGHLLEALSLCYQQGTLSIA